MGHQNVLKFGFFLSHWGPDLPDLARYSLIPLSHTHEHVYSIVFQYLHTPIFNCGLHARGIELRGPKSVTLHIQSPLSAARLWLESLFAKKGCRGFAKRVENTGSLYRTSGWDLQQSYRSCKGLQCLICHASPMSSRHYSSKGPCSRKSDASQPLTRSHSLQVVGVPLYHWSSHQQALHCSEGQGHLWHLAFEIMDPEFLGAKPNHCSWSSKRSRP